MAGNGIRIRECGETACSVSILKKVVAVFAFILFLPDAINNGILPISETIPIPPTIAPVAASPNDEFFLLRINSPVMIKAEPPPSKVKAADF